jgi:hypothetical protein
MALMCECPKGHIYVQADVPMGIPPGAPVCPTCFQEWAKEHQSYSKEP